MTKNIAWMVPDVIEGSGGLRTIFGKAAALATRGYRNDYYFYKSPPEQLAELAADMGRHFGVIDGGFFAGPHLRSNYDLSIATMWDSVKIVRDHPANTKLHFVQDFEAWFNPMGDGVLSAENAYFYGVKPITLGRWLHRMLEFHCDIRGYLCDFGVDRSVYGAPTTSTQREDAVCFIFQPEKPRRCWQNGIEALGIVKALRPSTTIYLYGSHDDVQFWFDTTNLKMLRPSQLADLYQRCKAGLCISSSNPSRIPFEMMACGLPVVDIYRTNNLYDYPTDSILLAHQMPESIAAAIIALLDGPRLAEKISRGARTFIEGHSQAAEDEDFCRACEMAFQGTSSQVTARPLQYAREPVIAEIFRTKQVKTFLSRQKTNLEGPYPEGPSLAETNKAAPIRRSAHTARRLAVAAPA